LFENVAFCRELLSQKAWVQTQCGGGALPPCRNIVLGITTFEILWLLLLPPRRRQLLDALDYIVRLGAELWPSAGTGSTHHGFHRGT
jgi:hypothetical protein